MIVAFMDQSIVVFSSAEADPKQANTRPSEIAIHRDFIEGPPSECVVYRVGPAVGARSADF